MTAAARQVFFVDSRVADYQTLIAGLAEGTEWHLVHAGEDGIGQMERILSAHSRLDAIQILSHGAPGTLYLGSTVLTSGNLASYEAALQEPQRRPRRPGRTRGMADWRPAFASGISGGLRSVVPSSARRSKRRHAAHIDPESFLRSRGETT